MERRSGRLRSLPPKSMAEEGSDVEMAVPPEAETSTAAAKKPAKPRKRREVALTNVSGIQAQLKKPRGKRGLLKDVVDMPMDVLYEIFSQLDPMDLLNLARTTKDLRGILMRRGSKSVWKQAFTNVSPPGLPDCPSDLSEPQYAELAFGKTCTFCDRKLSIIHIVWEARVRTCNKCLEQNFSTDLLYEPHALRDLVPGIHVQKSSGRRRNYGRFLVYHKVCTQWRQEYSALNEVEKRDWVKKKVAERQLIRRHAERCDAWAELRQNMLQDQKATIVEERKGIVMDYIRSLGWGEELEKMPNGVSQPGNDPTIAKFCQKDISPRGLEGMTDYLNEYMEGVQSRRIFREQKEVLQIKIITLKVTYTSYLLTLPPTEFYPNTADIYGDQSVKEILKGTSADLTDEQVSILHAIFPELLQTWQEPLHRKLIQLISEVTIVEKFVFDPSSVLDLVATTFHCTNCGQYMQAKKTITHRCTRDPHVYGKNVDEEQELLKSTIKEICWNTNSCLAFSTNTTKRVAESLEACSFDSTTTTVAQIEKADPVFECLACHNVLSGRCMMRWSGLYSHSVTHTGTRPAKLIVVSEEDTTIARARMNEEYERHHAREHRSSMCTHCRMLGALLAILEHVKTAHEVEKPKPGVDLIVVPGASAEPFIYRFWPPRLKEDVEEMMGEPVGV